MKIWLDSEGDFLEVIFFHRPGYMRETAHEAVMERVDRDGNILGFSVMKVSQFRKEKPLTAELRSSPVPRIEV